MNITSNASRLKIVAGKKLTVRFRQPEFRRGRVLLQHGGGGQCHAAILVHPPAFVEPGGLEKAPNLF